MPSRHLASIRRFASLLATVVCVLFANTVHSAEEIPILAAIKAGDLEAVEALLGEGTDLEVGDSEGFTPLATAAFEGRPAIARLLLSAGADPNSRSKDQGTPLLWASYKGHVEVVSLLLESGAEVDAVLPDGQSSLHLAGATGHAEVARLLLRGGADPTLLDKGHGFTPLHAAVMRGHFGLLDVWLSEGLDVDARDRTGATLLHQAAFSGNVEMARALLKAGGDPELEAPDGVTPLALAESRGHAAVVELFAAISAEPGPPNDLIRNAQVALNDLGYSVGTPDGILGPRSIAALEEFVLDWGRDPATAESPSTLEFVVSTSKAGYFQTSRAGASDFVYTSKYVEGDGQTAMGSLRGPIHLFSGDMTKFVGHIKEDLSAQVISAAAVSGEPLSALGRVFFTPEGFVVGRKAKSGWQDMSTVAVLSGGNGADRRLEMTGVSFWVNRGGSVWWDFSVKRITEDGKDVPFEIGIEAVGQISRPFVSVDGVRLSPRVRSLDKIEFAQ